MTTFSDRLKEAMYAQNLKQIDLVHIAAENNVKLGKSHVSQYVSGKTVPRNDILHFLAVPNLEHDYVLNSGLQCCIFFCSAKTFNLAPAFVEC